MKEPMFMQEIHANQKKRYERDKGLTLTERLKKLQEECNKVLVKI